MMEKLKETDFKKYIENINNCFFLEIGANDGITLDPLYPLIIKNKLSGIFVEPGDIAFESLKKNYSECSNIIFEKSVISDVTGEKILYCGTTTMHYSLSKKYAEWMFDVTPEIKNVNSYTPLDLLKKYNINHIDVLLIDTEGYDFIILKLFPFNITTPKVIRVEFVHIANENCTEKDLIEFLENKNYICYYDENNTDIIAILK